MNKPSFFHNLHKLFLLVIISLTGLSGLTLAYSSYNNYQDRTREIRDNSLSVSKSLLQRNIQNIKSLAKAKTSNIEDQIKNDVFYRVQEAIDVAYEIYSGNNRDKDPETIKEMIRDSLRGVRYNHGTGYYFIENFKSRTIFLYPPNPAFEGQSFEVLGEKGITVTNNFTSLIKSFGDGFYSYSWPKINNQDTLYKKIAFVKLFAPYDWYIGSGLYIDDYEQVIQEKIIKDVQAFYINNNRYVLLNENFDVLVGDPEGTGIDLQRFNPGKFQQSGDTLYYAEEIEEFNWLIGSTTDLGFINQQIIDELQQTKTRAFTQLGIIFTITLLLIILFLGLLKKLKRRFQNSFDIFSMTFEQAAKTNQTIQADDIEYIELEDLCKTANIMINENMTIKGELEELVEKRTAALKEAQNRLLTSERLSVLGQLTATVSHELRNPLGAISNGLHNIETALAADNREMASKALNLSERSVYRCARIIEELLDYGQKGRLEQKPVDIDELIHETLDEMKWPEGLDLRRELTSGAVISGDRERLRRALLNLVSNALQALQESSQTDKQILIATWKDENNVELVIEDNGPGVPDDLREKIFEPLFSTKNFGVGLGMTIVREIIQMHEGKVTLLRPPRGGCRFIVRIPLSKS